MSILHVYLLNIVKTTSLVHINFLDQNNLPCMLRPHRKPLIVLFSYIHIITLHYTITNTPHKQHTLALAENFASSLLPFYSYNQIRSSFFDVYLLLFKIR